MNAATAPLPDRATGPVHPALADLLARPVPEAIGAFLADNASPLIEDGAATFFWRGHADAVALLRWINAGVERTPFAQLGETGLWLLRMPVENGGRFEYKLAVTRHGHEEWMLDPANPVRAPDPFGENSVCRTLGYERPDWSRAQGAPAGRIEPIEIDSEAFGESRREAVYLPAGYDPDGAYPLVVIHDGDDFMAYGDLAASLDNLIASGDIPPVLVLLAQTGDRMGEYPSGRRHARYLATEALPALERGYAISGAARERVLLGASLGAVASLATAFRYPGTFGGLVLMSGSFILDERKLKGRVHPVFHRIAKLVRVLRRAPELPPTRAFVSTGELEGLADQNRALADLLKERGVDVLFQSTWDGHHWHNWRDQLRDGLMWVLRPEGGKD